MRIIVILLFFCFSLGGLEAQIMGFQAYSQEASQNVLDTAFLTLKLTDFSNQNNGLDLIGEDSIALWRNCVRYKVVSIDNVFSSQVRIGVIANALPSGYYTLISENDIGTGGYVSGINDSDNQCILNYYLNRLGNGFGGGGETYNDTILPFGTSPVSRTFSVGTNLQASTIKEWIQWHYIGNATPPTLSMNSLSPSLVEVGSSNIYTLSGSLTNTCNYTIGTRLVDGTSWSGSNYTKVVNYTPTTATNKSYSATATWTNVGSTCAAGGASSGTASASRTVTSVYPVLWGMSATSYTGGSVPYNIWSKRIATEGNQSGLTMTGTNEYIYILIPKSWIDFNVNTIIDHNGFNVTPSFTAYDVTVTSTGLASNWTQAYKLYKLNNLTTASGFNYVYNR